MSANTEAQGSGRGLEAMKWVVVVALLLVAIVGNYLYRDIMLPLRALAVVILIAAAGGVALLTTKGKATVAFAREAAIHFPAKRAEAHLLQLQIRQHLIRPLMAVRLHQHRALFRLILL